jgi:hypothetical protein
MVFWLVVVAACWVLIPAWHAVSQAAAGWPAVTAAFTHRAAAGWSSCAWPAADSWAGRWRSVPFAGGNQLRQPVDSLPALLWKSAWVVANGSLALFAGHVGDIRQHFFCTSAFCIVREEDLPEESSRTRLPLPPTAHLGNFARQFIPAPWRSRGAECWSQGMGRPRTGTLTPVSAMISTQLTMIQ